MSDLSDEHYDSAITSLQAGQLDDALNAIEECLTEDHEDVGAWQLYALILTAAQRPEDAAKASAKAEELSTSEGDSVESLLMRAASAAVEGRHPQAISLYEDALEMDGARFDVWLNYALVLIQEGYTNDAMDAAAKAVELKEDSGQAWYVQGRVLRLCDKPEEALEAFEKSLTLQDNMAVCWYERGMVLSLLERHQDALPCYEKVLELQPGDPSASQALAMTRAQLGQS